MCVGRLVGWFTYARTSYCILILRRTGCSGLDWSRLICVFLLDVVEEYLTSNTDDWGGREIFKSPMISSEVFEIEYRNRVALKNMHFSYTFEPMQTRIVRTITHI